MGAEPNHTDTDGRIALTVEDRLWLIGIDRPAKYNGFTPKMLREYSEIITRYDADETAFCAIVYAHGPHFTAGLDLPKLAEVWARGESPYPADCLDMWNLRPPFRRKPLIMAVKGICYTVGVELMLSADIVVAAEDCRFTQLEVKRGIMAAGGATIRMVERAGWGAAMRYLLTGDEWNAEQALRMNMVQEVVPVGQELEVAKEIANKIVKNAAPLAVQATIANARLALQKGADAAVAQFDETRLKLRATNDAQEGVASFKEKRSPVFHGR